MIFMDAAKGQYIHWLPDVLRLMKEGSVLVSDNVLQEETLSNLIILWNGETGQFIKNERIPLAADPQPGASYIGTATWRQGGCKCKNRRTGL